MDRSVSRLGVVILTTLALVMPAACTTTHSPDKSPPGDPSTTGPTGDTATGLPTRLGSQILYSGGVILTMEAAMPVAEALLVEGDIIVAVGGLDEVRALADNDARQVDLGGWTLLPGFIDSHSHRITQRFKWGLGTELESTLGAVSEGWTGIDELALQPEEFEALVEADRRGDLLVRVNAYLAVNPFAGGEVDYWFAAYQPGEVISPNLRIAGLKIFIDVDSGRTLLWEPDELADFVAQRHAEGWQISMKAIGRRSHELALHALEGALGGGPNHSNRHRLEHSLAVSDDQLAQMARMGIIAAIQPGFPGVVWYEEDIRDLVAEEGVATMFRWPEYLAAGVIAAASPYNPDPGHPELVEASHVSPMGVIYRAVTQVGPGGAAPEPWMLDRALAVDQLLPMLTINGAYASGVDGARGSLAAGKLADLVVLDGDPRSVTAGELLDVSVQMTMVGGVVRYLQPGAGHLLGQPGSSLPETPEPPETPETPETPDTIDVAARAVVSASSELEGNPAANAVDGTSEHWNAADLAPQWIELLLERPTDVVRITLVVAQDPSGHSVHELWIGRAGHPPELVTVFEGVTFEGDLLVYQPDEPVEGVELVRVVTTSLGDLFPAWRQIEVLGTPR